MVGQDLRQHRNLSGPIPLMAHQMLNVNGKHWIFPDRSFKPTTSEENPRLLVVLSTSQQLLLNEQFALC